LLKLHLFELVQRGNLAVAEEKHWYGTKRWLVAVADTPDRHYLSPLEQSLLAREWPHDPYLPAENLVGCASFIFYSTTAGNLWPVWEEIPQTRWDRLMTKIH
jgi:hypothetical protein